jgi:hypothetical protein
MDGALVLGEIGAALSPQKKQSPRFDLEAATADQGGRIMARADFNMIHFNHHFTTGSDEEVIKNFRVEVTGNQRLTDDAYLLVQVQGVAATHSIKINSSVLESGALLPAPGSSSAWRVGMNHIPPGVLRRNDNEITIKRFGNDEFRVGWVVVHWREE